MKEFNPSKLNKTTEYVLKLKTRKVVFAVWSSSDSQAQADISNPSPRLKEHSLYAGFLIQSGLNGRLRFSFILRKEVIQPHLPIRLPCYDFTPIIGPTLGG